MGIMGLRVGDIPIETLTEYLAERGFRHERLVSYAISIESPDGMRRAMFDEFLRGISRRDVRELLDWFDFRDSDVNVMMMELIQRTEDGKEYPSLNIEEVVKILKASSDAEDEAHRKEVANNSVKDVQITEKRRKLLDAYFEKLRAENPDRKE